VKFRIKCYINLYYSKGYIIKHSCTKRLQRYKFAQVKSEQVKIAKVIMAQVITAKLVKYTW